jgi:hypothetical protein
MAVTWKSKPGSRCFIGSALFVGAILFAMSQVENGRRFFLEYLTSRHLDQVSEQWLKEACPRQYLTSDAVVARQSSRGRSNNSEGSSGSEENG